MKLTNNKVKRAYEIEDTITVALLVVTVFIRYLTCTMYSFYKFRAMSTLHMERIVVITVIYFPDKKARHMWANH